MTVLRVVLDDPASAARDGIRSAEDLARELAATAPEGSHVVAIVPAASATEREERAQRLPGIELLSTALPRRPLALAWQRGVVTLPGRGIVHATGLLAPLRAHDRFADPETQIAVTIHDALAWTHPEVMPSRAAAWARAMGRRAERFADAVVVPTHAVAGLLADHLDLGDRVRVIGEAAGVLPTPPDDGRARRRDLGLPERYVLAVTDGGPLSGAVAAMEAVGALTDVALVIAGAADRDELLARAARSAASVTVLGDVSDADLAAVYRGAAVYVQPDLLDTSVVRFLDAMASGLPIVHSDAPSLVELSAGSGIEVARGDDADYSTRLAEAIEAVLDDDDLSARLRLAASDRAKAFTRRDAAELVWQLHADL